MQRFVENITYDHWRENIYSEGNILSPNVSDVYKAIDMLDAKNTTIICLHGEDGSFLTIGGGLGQYVVFASTQDAQLWNLHSAEIESDRKIFLNAGGQVGEYQARQIVNKETVVQCAVSFFSHGTLEPSNQWEKQD